jgi:hypothetical protein
MGFLRLLFCNNIKAKKNSFHDSKCRKMVHNISLFALGLLVDFHGTKAHFAKQFFQIPTKAKELNVCYERAFCYVRMHVVLDFVVGEVPIQVCSPKGRAPKDISP